MNQLAGVITSVCSSEGIHLIEAQVGDVCCAATLTGDGVTRHWEAGQSVRLAFRELEVSLAKDLNGQISIRNLLPCHVTAVMHGEVLTRVQLAFSGQTLHSVITRNSAQRLKLAAGDQVTALIKASAVMLQAEQNT